MTTEEKKQPSMKKLLELQKKIKAITKDETNPFFHSKYFDVNKLAEVLRPILNEVGLVLIQPLSHLEGRTAIRTILIDPDSGEKLVEDITPLPDNPDPQKMGSAITYFRRYAIQSLLFLQAEDDDANRASTPVAQKAYVKPTVKTPVLVSDFESKCTDCGAPKAMSQAGNSYCSAKCWLAKTPVVTPRTGMAHAPATRVEEEVPF